MLRQLGQQLRRVGLSYNSAALKRPQTTAIVTTVVKTSAADAFAQLVGACSGFLHGSWRVMGTHACGHSPLPRRCGRARRADTRLCSWLRGGFVPQMCCVQCNQRVLDVQREEGRQHLGERDASLVCTLQIGSCSDGPTTNKISRVPEHTSASMVCTQKVESCVSAGGLQVIEGRDEIDVPRHAMFCMFG